MIPKEAFYSEAIFEAEMRQLFDAGFLFVGLTSELANERDFVTLDYPGAAIVVQNFKGELRAFQNVCAHQFAKVQYQTRGNRPLMCRYHGWNYGADGYAFGIPKRSEYKLDEVPRECLTLKPYRVETCGSFVFVARPECTLSLPEWLGPYWSHLEELSRHIGREYTFQDLPHGANWKLLVENVLDSYHIATLHRETFLADGFAREAPHDVLADGPHSSFHIPRTPTGDEKHEAVRRRLRSHLDARQYRHDSYFHILIFPNLFVSSTEGTTFFVGQALPEAPDRTNLRVRYFEPALELAPRHRPKQDLVNQVTSENGIRIILEEDLPVLESVQQGLRMTDLPGFVGEGEFRIRAWRDAYNRAMTNGLAAALSTGTSMAQVA